jgi:signal transduction histidine kinase/DNA-binding NarL/FixJ family response regulator
MTGIFWWKMEGEEHEFSGEEIRTGDLSSEQIFNGIPGSDSSRSFSCGNICEIINNCVTCKYRRFRVQPQSDSLNGGGGKQENFGYRKAHCLSSYYSVFVARLAIMVMLAILIGLLTILTWHFTTVYTTKSIKSLAYGLRYELLQRPISRMFNILNSTVEITMAQVRLSEYVVGRYPLPRSPYQQVQLYDVMMNITWALFASRKALTAITINYGNGRVQAFHRDRKDNSTFYIFSEPANSTLSNASRQIDDKERTLNAPFHSWANSFITQSNSSIWYREPLDPSTGEKNGPPKQIPPDGLINIAGISQIQDGGASWHVTVSKYSDTPLLSSASPVIHPTKKSIVAVVGVRSALSSVGQLMKELVELHSGYMYLTSQEGYLIATSTDDPLMMNTSGGPKLMTAVESSHPIIRAGALWLQKKYGNRLSFSKGVHVENVLLERHRYYIDSFMLNLTRLPLVGVIIIPRSFVMGEVDRRGRATLIILVSASICILVIGCVCILILTSGVSKEMKLRAELISHLDARRRAEASSNYKSQFLANMSHELRTPMAAVIGLLDILLCDEYLTTEQIAIVSQIRRCSTALLRLLNNILDLSKVESGKLVLEEAEFDLGHELEGLVDMFSVQCVDHNIEIILDLDDNVPKVVRGDSARVVQIFANLISNSIKFTSSGHIILRAWCENSIVNNKTDGASENGRDSWFSRKLSFGQSERKTYPSQEKITIWFEVEDTGCGIDPSKWESVFESFVQADLSTTRTYGGTGLGLCIVRSLVHKMGGKINIQQKEGPGTLMHLSLVFGIPAENSGQFSQHFWNRFGKESSMVLLALKDDTGRSKMSQWLYANGIQSYEASNWNEIPEILSREADCHYHPGLQTKDSVQLESIPNHGVSVNEFGCANIKEDSMPANETRVLHHSFVNQLSKYHNFFVVIDTRFLDTDMNSWKAQVSHLNKYQGSVKFAWLLNHDTSTTVKLELRRMGHYITVNKPLYKSKLIQTLTTMIEDTTYELEKMSTGSRSPNLQLDTKQSVNIQSPIIPTKEGPSDYFLDKDGCDSAKDIGEDYRKSLSRSLCPTIPASISAARSLNSSPMAMKEGRNFIPYPMKELNGLETASQTLTKSENEKGSPAKKCRYDSIRKRTNTDDFCMNTDSIASPESHSGICNEDSLGDMDRTKSSMVNSISKQYNGHAFNIQLASKVNNNPDNEKLPCDVSCIPTCPSCSSIGFTGSVPYKLESKEHLSPHPSASNDNGRPNCIKNQMTSKEFQNPPVQVAPSHGISSEKSLEGIHILLAEDTPVLQRVASIMLEKMGATLVAVGDGLQAVDALKSAYNVGDSDKLTSTGKIKNSGKQMISTDLPPFDLVLMDCQMPKMDGYEATKAIRTAEKGTNQHIPIVALTAHAMSSDEAKCLEVGMDAYLTKPIDYKLMASTILALVKKKS